MIKVNLKQLLKKKGMSMTELHEKTGVSQNALSLMANGKSNGIQFNTLDKILKATNASLDEVLEHTGELYTLFVEREEKNKKSDSINYKITARNPNNEEVSWKFTFYVTHYIQNTRHIIQISYSSYELDSKYDELFMKNVFQQRDSKVLVPFSYLVAYDLINHIQIEGLNLNSLVLFTWYGFVLFEDEEVYKIPLAPRDDNVELEFNENYFDVLPNVRYLESLPNIEAVRCKPQIGYCEIDIYVN
ncbi:helix-turn-helix transcriptional regulator [Metabacillus dongyingensis]|uniref:helix-turn-helix domain-containing protein n=1 Tax=Metabacillus dongyingensis TaxID=2874282 RepID=UPI003B8C912A